jgi:3-hydroxyacyl-CoA dehydrogenase
MGITKMPMGPFGIIDLIGVDLLAHIANRGRRWTGLIPGARRVRAYLAPCVATGKLGVKTGEGF